MREPTFSERMDMNEAVRKAAKLIGDLADFAYLARAGLSEADRLTLEEGAFIVRWWSRSSPGVTSPNPIERPDDQGVTSSPSGRGAPEHGSEAWFAERDADVDDFMTRDGT